MNPFSQAVVIVDDDSAVLDALTAAFTAQGFEVQGFPSAEALLSAPELPQEGCLVLDYRLPGLNGLELLQALRDRNVLQPAILITTATPQALAAAVRANVPLIDKPQIDALQAKVREALGHAVSARRT